MNGTHLVASMAALWVVALMTTNALAADTITYTYVYEPDSVPPNVPEELAAPHMLNDGLIGSGWDATTQLYGTWPVFPVAKIPYVTLTLAPHAGLGKLTVWYARAIEAGVGEPASVTVSDDLGHSATTPFVPPGANGTFSQDVGLAVMQGTVLHLNFTCTREWLGLVEVRVFTPEALPPAVPVMPIPSDGNVSVPLTASLGWNSSVGADGYEVYLWCPPAPRPLTGSASVTANSWTPSGILPVQTNYSWQVVATNAYGSATGAVWTFQTGPFPYTYTYDDESARPENYEGGHGETRSTPHLLSDGKAGGLWSGGGLVLYYGNDYLGSAAAFDAWPAITITLPKAPYKYEYLRIWHYGGGVAGVHAPTSVTITDDSLHTTSHSFPDVETVTDVPISGMAGRNLHLRFGANPEFVGLSEIKVMANARPPQTVIVVR